MLGMVVSAAESVRGAVAGKINRNRRKRPEIVSMTGNIVVDYDRIQRELATELYLFGMSSGDREALNRGIIHSVPGSPTEGRAAVRLVRVRFAPEAYETLDVGGELAREGMRPATLAEFIVHARFGRPAERRIGCIGSVIDDPLNPLQGGYKAWLSEDLKTMRLAQVEQTWHRHFDYLAAIDS